MGGSQEKLEGKCGGGFDQNILYMYIKLSNTKKNGYGIIKTGTQVPS